MVLLQICAVAVQLSVPTLYYALIPGNVSKINVKMLIPVEHKGIQAWFCQKLITFLYFLFYTNFMRLKESITSDQLEKHKEQNA